MRTLSRHLGGPLEADSHVQVFILADDTSGIAAAHRGILLYDLQANAFCHHTWYRDRPVFAGILEVGESSKAVAMAMHAESFKSSYGVLKISSNGITSHAVTNSWHPSDVGDVLSFSRAVVVSADNESANSGHIVYHTAPCTALGFPVSYEELKFKELGVANLPFVSQIDGSYSLKYHSCSADDGFRQNVVGLCMLSLGHGVVSVQMSRAGRPRMHMRGQAMEDDFTEDRIREWMAFVGTIYDVDMTTGENTGDVLNLRIHIEQCSYPLWFCTGDDVMLNLKVNEAERALSLAWECTMPFVQLFEKGNDVSPAFGGSEVGFCVPRSSSPGSSVNPLVPNDPNLNARERGVRQQDSHENSPSTRRKRRQSL